VPLPLQADQAAEEILQLLFVRDLQQFGGQLHFLLLIEDTLA